MADILTFSLNAAYIGSWVSIFLMARITRAWGIQGCASVWEFRGKATAGQADGSTIVFGHPAFRWEMTASNSNSDRIVP